MRGFLVRVEVFTAMTMQETVFWDLVPCSIFSSQFTCPDDGGDMFL
jgi:hypothetical protein